MTPHRTRLVLSLLCVAVACTDPDPSGTPDPGDVRPDASPATPGDADVPKPDGSTGDPPRDTGVPTDSETAGPMDAAAPPPADAGAPPPPDAGLPPGPGATLEDPGHVSDTAAQLAAFYGTYGGRAAFPPLHRDALEALLAAEDAVSAGDLGTADAAIESVFAQVPRGDAGWWLNPADGTGGSNIGHPVAYYGLRMLEQVVDLGLPAEQGVLDMTIVVAPCAQVRRPGPDLEPEVADVEVHPALLEDAARRLFLSTHLFGQWVRAITRGLRLAITIHVLEGCTQVDYRDDGGNIFSYPDGQAMIDAVDRRLAARTDLWMVVTPTGRGPAEDDIGRRYVTGGMGLSNDGRPLFLSDDVWFVRKPHHLGAGEWTEAELRSYHPQWFQHEFMHHLFRAWPQFRLEVDGHDWFDRDFWPDDFVGLHEPDYYAEALTRRLLGATPSLADGLQAPEIGDATGLGAAELVGAYRREPVENPWHEVTVARDGDGLRWHNAADVSWALHLEDGDLRTGEDCPYGVQSLGVEVQAGRVVALWFGGEAYRRAE
jgi:hypothetical protein